MVGGDGETQRDGAARTRTATEAALQYENSRPLPRGIGYVRHDKSANPNVNISSTCLVRNHTTMCRHKLLCTM